MKQAEIDAGARPGMSTGGDGADRRAGAGEPRAAPGQRDPEDGGGFLRGGARPPLTTHDRLHRRHRDGSGSSRSAASCIGAGAAIAPSTYYAAKTRPPSARAVRDEQLKVRDPAGARRELRRLRRATRSGASWAARASAVARCTVERLMRELGLAGAVRAAQEPGAPPCRSRAERPGGPGRAGLHRGGAEPAVGGRPHLRAHLDRVRLRRVRHRRVLPADRRLAAVQPAAHRPGARRAGDGDLDPPARAGRRATGRPGWCTTPTAGCSTWRSATPNASPTPARSPRSAHAATATTTPWPRPQSGCTRPSSSAGTGPWRSSTHVELAIAEWVDWYNHRRLHGASDNIPPVEYEQNHYQRRAQTDPAA